jgi:cardiolipin synthase
MWYWIYQISGWALTVVLIPILARRHAPSKALGWLAIMFALPWVGHALYVAFAENPLGRRRVARYRWFAETSPPGRRLIGIAGQTPAEHLGPRDRALEQLARSCGALAAAGGNDATLIDNHDEMVRSVERDIDAARHHVHMIFYIFRADATGQRIGEALCRAARRGVRCRVIADWVGSYHLDSSDIGQAMKDAGVQLRLALPANPLRKRLRRFDLRNHRKLIVVDAACAYLGSWNVLDPAGSPARAGPYEDLAIRLTGPVVPQAQLLFLEDWQFETGEDIDDDDVFVEPQGRGDVSAQVVASGPLYPCQPVRDLTVTMIGLARRRVILTTPYFVPDQPLQLALRLAAQRGVRVDLLGPMASDSRVVDAAALAYHMELIQAGVRVHLLAGTFLHGKGITVDDDACWLGSANMDIRSFRLNVESNLLIFSNAVAKAMRELLERRIAAAEEITPHWLRRRWFTTRISGQVAKLASPLI